jgi:hypothetical protein
VRAFRRCRSKVPNPERETRSPLETRSRTTPRTASTIRAAVGRSTAVRFTTSETRSPLFTGGNGMPAERSRQSCFAAPGASRIAYPCSSSRSGTQRRARAARIRPSASAGQGHRRRAAPQLNSGGVPPSFSGAHYDRTFDTRRKSQRCSHPAADDLHSAKGLSARSARFRREQAIRASARSGAWTRLGFGIPRCRRSVRAPPPATPTQGETARCHQCESHQR